MQHFTTLMGVVGLPLLTLCIDVRNRNGKIHLSFPVSFFNIFNILCNIELIIGPITVEQDHFNLPWQQTQNILSFELSV